MGSVLEFTDTTKRKVVILDAAYRGSATFLGSSIGTYDFYPAIIFSNYGTVSTFTDTKINSFFLDVTTSREWCNKWITASIPAVSYCRNITIPSLGKCDLPNANTLIRIRCDADIIDSLDPTVEANKRKALGSTNPSGILCIDGLAYSWASTPHKQNSASVHGGYQTAIRNTGLNSNYRDGTFSVIPIYEL